MRNVNTRVGIAFAMGLSFSALIEASEAKPEVKGSIEKVEVTGQQSDLAHRKNSTAAKQTFGREEIERLGGANAAELLKQLPGIELNRYGGLALRGLQGYTQILVDGKPPAPGVQALDLPLSQLERVEVLRGATAEFAGQGIGGTINLVLRTVKPRKRMNEWSGSAGVDSRGVTPSLSWVRHGQWTRDTSYTSSLGYSSFQWSGRVREMEGREGQGAVDVETANQGRVKSVNARVRARVQNVEQGELGLNLGGFVFGNRSEVQQSQRSADPLPFDHVSTRSRRDGQAINSELSWQRPWGESGTIKLESGLSDFRADSHARRQEAIDDPATLLERLRIGREHKRRASWGLKWNDTGLREGHQLSAGLEGSYERETTKIERWRQGEPDLELSRYLGAGMYGRHELAVFVQDEWELSPGWSANLGWRWQHSRLAGNLGAYDRRNAYSVHLPSVNLLHKLDKAGRDQIRLGLSRSFKAPELSQLMQRPTISPFFPCPPDRLCDLTNSLLHPDTAGNSALRPERAWGLDASWERSLEGEGLFSVGFFHRRLQDRLALALVQQPVEWASVPRWVNLPLNLGRAWSQGVELEFKQRLDMLSSSLPPWLLRASASVYRSRDATLPAPYNHLADQGRGSAKLGLGQQLKSLPLNWSMDARWQAGGLTRISPYELMDVGAHWDLDASLGWRFSPELQLRLKVSNLLARHKESRSLFAQSPTSQALRRDQDRAAQRSWMINLDAKY